MSAFNFTANTIDYVRDFDSTVWFIAKCDNLMCVETSLLHIHVCYSMDRSEIDILR